MILPRLRMAQRRFELPVGLVPGRRPRVEERYPLGFAPLELAEKQLAEQPVVSELLASVIEGNDQQVPVVDLLEQRGRADGVERGIAQRSVEAVEDRRSHQELARSPSQMIEDLDSKVVTDEPAVSPQPQRGFGPGPSDLHRESREVQARRPSLGSIDELREVELVGIDPGTDEQAGGLADVECEVPRTDLEQSSARPEAARQALGRCSRDERKSRTPSGSPGREVPDEIDALGVGARFPIDR